MNENELLEVLARMGLKNHAAVDSWNCLSRLLTALELIGRDGGHAMIKVDGERDDCCVYTVLISGGRLGDRFFRKDGSDLHSLLREAIEFWVTQV